MEKLIGAGWSYPGRRVRDTGGVELVRGVAEIEQAIRLILTTVPGERPMRPDFGCEAYALVFDPIDGATAGRVSYDVRTALERWEPRIEVIAVEAHTDTDAGEDGRLCVELTYRVRADGQTRTLVVPFYTVPRHDAPGR
ncbi:GPW/gp25 family protein [Streptomyces orinoci]|uniref:GPW/gp25 family protein n=1 Tax=Streptomyces orinoci TaxID=67339 RepID=A0ABV3K0H6_STRON|nr:GPW/gp25 family protein [Streptomyces orinoci]